MRGFTAYLAAIALLGCDSKGLYIDGATDGAGDPALPGDADGDTILDGDEGRGAGVDTDGDTIPDYLDTDSDGDRIPDSMESGDGNPDTPPVDSDGDGTPDFRDLDSDENGVLDVDEGAVDMDGDGRGNHADPDNDGDGLDDVTELGGTPSAPPDSDGDGMPDYKDLDSDDDMISDRHEGNVDTDGDGIPDRLDLDTDGDTIPDSEEAGDEDISTPPVDTDGDSVPDFRDLDSDADGLSDAWEWEHGTDPRSEDSDGDGWPDLIEVGADTDPLDSTDHPGSGGDFVFIMYYNEPGTPGDEVRDPIPEVDHLVFSTSLLKADVFFTLDSSGSMGGEINNLRTTLASTVVPGILAEIPDVWFGVGRFEDCASCTHNMSMPQEVTDDVMAVEAALTGWSACGGYEPYTQNLYALATGDLTPFLGWGGITPTAWTCTPPGELGWPCFRRDALPIIVQFGDEDFDEAIGYCSPSTNHDQAITALNGISAKYIGVNSGIGSYSSHADFVIIANGTGSVDSAGNPLVFDISSDGSGLGAQVVDAVEILANNVPIEVTTVLRDDPSDLVDTVAEFIDYVEPSTVGGWPDPTEPWVICVGGLEVDDLRYPLDGRPDSFTAVLPGTPVCFDIHVKQNWSVPSRGEPQVFMLEIDVVGDGITVLDTRSVYFLVPPMPEF